MWFFFFAFSMFMLPNSAACFLFLAWNGISFFARFFLSTRNLLPLLQLVLDRAGTLTRRIFPFNLLKLTRNGAAFLAKDSRKWLSYVCRTRFHTFSLSHLLSPLSRCSLTAHCFFFLNIRSNGLFFYVWYLLALLQSTLAQTLFCLIVYI